MSSLLGSLLAAPNPAPAPTATPVPTTNPPVIAEEPSPLRTNPFDTSELIAMSEKINATRAQKAQAAQGQVAGGQDEQLQAQKALVQSIIQAKLGQMGPLKAKAARLQGEMSAPQAPLSGGQVAGSALLSILPALIAYGAGGKRGLGKIADVEGLGSEGYREDLEEQHEAVIEAKSKEYEAVMDQISSLEDFDSDVKIDLLNEIIDKNMIVFEHPYQLAQRRAGKPSTNISVGGGGTYNVGDDGEPVLSPFAGSGKKMLNATANWMDGYTAAMAMGPTAEKLVEQLNNLDADLPEADWVPENMKEGRLKEFLKDANYVTDEAMGLAYWKLGKTFPQIGDNKIGRVHRLTRNLAAQMLKAMQGSRPSDWDLKFYLDLITGNVFSRPGVVAQYIEDNVGMMIQQKTEEARIHYLLENGAPEIKQLLLGVGMSEQEFRDKFYAPMPKLDPRLTNLSTAAEFAKTPDGMVEIANYDEAMRSRLVYVHLPEGASDEEVQARLATQAKRFDIGTQMLASKVGADGQKIYMLMERVARGTEGDTRKLGWRVV